MTPILSSATVRQIAITEALARPGLLGTAMQGPSWWPWRTFYKVLYGEPLDPGEASFAQARTQRSAADLMVSGPYSEAWLVVGRRAGKSRAAATLATFLATLCDWRPYLSPGETGTVLCLAADRGQASIIHSYIRALVLDNPLLRDLVVRETSDQLELQGNVTIAVGTSSFKSVRGTTLIAALLDETAFWQSEDSSSNPDREVYRALRPGLLTMAPHSMLIGLSSPYARRGLLWERYKRHFGKEGSKVLVWTGASRDMNATLDAEMIADALADDVEAGTSEYLGEFRSDLSALFALETLTNAVVPGRLELPFDSRHYGGYHAHIDPSGGSGRDSMTLGIAHHDDVTGRAVLDCVREVSPPFLPTDCVREFATVLASYGLHACRGDRYGGSWPAEAFGLHGVTYEPAELTTSATYLEVLPQFNSGKVELLEHRRLLGQFSGLERRTSRSGRDAVDHPPQAHDDLACAASGALLAASHPPLRLRVGGR